MWKNSHHLLGSYYVPGTVLEALKILTFNLHNNSEINVLRGWYLTPFFFIGEEKRLSNLPKCLQQIGSL